MLGKSRLGNTLGLYFYVGASYCRPSQIWMVNNQAARFKMENQEIQKISSLVERVLFEPLVERMLNYGIPVRGVIGLLDGFIAHNKVTSISKKWNEKRRSLTEPAQEEVLEEVLEEVPAA